MIKFSGEKGSDSGALLFEFYQEVTKKLYDECFEGTENRKIPRFNWGLEIQLKMAGAMIAHSVLQGGPGLPCIHPAIFMKIPLTSRFAEKGVVYTLMHQGAHS